MAKTKSTKGKQPVEDDSTQQGPSLEDPIQADAAEDESTPAQDTATQSSDEGSRPARTQVIPEPPSPPPPPSAPPPPPPEPLSPTDERTWAMLAHLSVFANLATGLLGPVIALVIYLVYQQRSRYVAYHAMQSFIFQLIWWVGGGALAALAWTVSGLLAVILIGCCLMPFALLISLIPLGALVYGAIGAIQTSQGQDFKYWLVGDWVRGTYTGA